MKILYFIESLGSGGKERRLVELIKGLAQDENIEMELVLYKDVIHYKEILKYNLKIHYILRKELRLDIFIMSKFYQIAKNYNPDIIHVWGDLPAVFALPVRLFLNIPLVNNQITNAPFKPKKSFIKHNLTFRHSDIIIANTYAGLKTFRVPKKKSKVIYNGFDFKRIKKLKNKELVRKELKIEMGFIVGMIASFSVKKDYYTFIQAAICILRKRNDIAFLCAGKGDFNKLKAIIEDKFKPNFFFLGNISDVESVMNICDVGVLMTGKIHGEGISNALLEFAALGKPLIANRSGGNGEIIEDERSGFLITPESIPELVERLLFFIDNRKEKLDFGQRSNEIVVEKFGISHMVNEFKNVYSHLK